MQSFVADTIALFASERRHFEAVRLVILWEVLVTFPFMVVEAIELTPPVWVIVLETPKVPERFRFVAFTVAANPGAASERIKVFAVPFMVDPVMSAVGFAPVVVEYPERMVEVEIVVNVQVEPAHEMDISGPEEAKVKAGPDAVPAPPTMVVVALPPGVAKS